MSYLSKITLPSGSSYNLKDALTRDYVNKILNGIATKFSVGSDYAKGQILYRAVEAEASQTVTIDIAKTNDAVEDVASWEALIIAGKLSPVANIGDEIKKLEDAIANINNFTYHISKTPSDTPTGVTNYYASDDLPFTGTLVASASTEFIIYIVKSAPSESTTNKNAEYITVKDGTTYKWECIGEHGTTFDYDTVDVIKSVDINPDIDSVLGESTTFKVPESTVIFTGNTDDKVLGETTTFIAKNGGVSLKTDTIQYEDIFDTDSITKFVPRTIYTVSNGVLTITESASEKIFLPKTTLSK